MLVAHAELARRLADLERKYDAQFRVVFDAIQRLMEPPPAPEHKRIGFRSRRASEDRGCYNGGQVTTRRTGIRRRRGFAREYLVRVRYNHPFPSATINPARGTRVPIQKTNIHFI